MGVAADVIGVPGVFFAAGAIVRLRLVVAMLRYRRSERAAVAGADTAGAEAAGAEAAGAEPAM